MKTARLALLLFGAAVLALPVGCQKGLEEKTGGSSSGIPADYDGLTATIEQGQKDCSNILGDEEFDEAVTKTALTGDDYVCWSDGDKIFVNGTATANTLTVVPFGIDATTAALNGTIPAPAASGRKYCGYYPASTTYWTVTASAKQVKLPSSITYNASSPLGNVPMYAESDDKHLTFKPLFGILEFTITGGQTVKTIKLSTTAGNIAGTFTIDATGKAVISGSGTKEVTMTTGDIELNPMTGAKFYFAVPEGTLTNLKIELTTDCGGEVNATISTLAVKNGQVYPCVWDAQPKAVQLWDGGPY